MLTGLLTGNFWFMDCSTFQKIKSLQHVIWFSSQTRLNLILEALSSGILWKVSVFLSVSPKKKRLKQPKRYFLASHRIPHI
jgi:hypothetical protein